jgi:predicted phosphodiesterase
LLIAAPALAEKWSFAVIADNRSAFASYRNVLGEIRDLRVNPPPRFPAAAFVLACGDLDPLRQNYAIYRDVFHAKPPVYLPVRGNHEKPDDVRFILDEILPAYGQSIHLRDRASINYTVDWENVRIIVLDQYPGYDKSLTRPENLNWLETAITSATNANHIFIAYHEPNLPKATRHDAFWKLLLKHQDKVRAVFNGHTHAYERRRVAEGKGGIEVINAGNAGQSKHGDQQQTIVEVMVDGPYVYVRVLRAPNGTSQFKLEDEWDTEDPRVVKVGSAGSGSQIRPHLPALPSPLNSTAP